MKKLILASSSPRRHQLLIQIGYKPDLVLSPDIDESEKKGESARNLASRLSYEKALKVSLEYPNDIVLGADTVVSVGKTILPKAICEEDAIYSIKKMSGRRHRVYTGVCVIYRGKIIKRIGLSIVKMKSISEEELDTFIRTKQWLNKAGGYGLQGLAAIFVEQINGTDTNILGLPACLTYKILSSLGLKPNIE